MGEFEDDVGGIIDPWYGICVAQIHEVGGRHHHLLNLPGPDDVVSKSCQNVCPPRNEHAVREDELFLLEDLDTLRFISLPHVISSANQFRSH